VIEEITRTLRPLAEAKSLSFETDMPTADISIATDRRALSQILLNLANNAIKFTDRGFVRMELRQRNGLTEFVVTDSGVGISNDDQEKLFTAFEQVRSDPRRRYEGTGLGLHLSQKLATLLNGKITLESKPGEGSRFTLALAAQP